MTDSFWDTGWLERNLNRNVGLQRRPATSTCFMKGICKTQTWFACAVLPLLTFSRLLRRAETLEIGGVSYGVTRDASQLP